MAQELEGLEYLKANKKQVEKMTCDTGKPYAFISYSHDNHDSAIVHTVFKKLYERGYNLWIQQICLIMKMIGVMRRFAH